MKKTKIRKGEKENMKNAIMAVIGTLGSVVASFFGGWTAAMTTLVIFIGIDYATGLICAGVFHKSQKTQSGALESKASFKGLCRKGLILLIVLMCHRMDLIYGGCYIRDGACIAFIFNESISIIENAGLMGVPIPKIVINAIEALKKKGENG